MVSKRSKITYSIILIVVLTGFSYLSSLDNDFINWDDPENVIGNLLIRDISWSNIKEIFTSYTDYYRPLVFITYAIEYSLFKLEPSAYHTTNLLFHILNTLLVFWLISLFTNKTLPALISALLFGVHPLHVESVAWVTERKDVLSTFFFLQAVIYYLFYTGKSKKVYYYLSLFAFLLALLSKPMVVTLPLILLLCDYLFYREFNRKNLLEKLPFFALSVVFGIATIFTQPQLSAERYQVYSNSLSNILIACWGVIFYLYKTIAPVTLSAFYPPPEVIIIMSPEYFFPPILLLLLAIAVFYSRRWTRDIVFGTLFFLITILPVILVIHVGDAVAADRYMYIPSIGLFFMIGLAFNRAYYLDGNFEKLRKASLGIFLCILIFTFSVLTYQRNNIWQNSKTLWLNVIKNYPDVLFAHDYLGDSYRVQGRLDEAIQEYQVALKLIPRSNINLESPTLLLLMIESTIRNDLGVTFAKKERLNDAINEFEIAIRLRPDNEKPHFNLGNAYTMQGQFDDAILEYRIALRLRPENAEAHSKLGYVFTAKGQFDTAYREFEEALAIEETASRHWSAALASEKLDRKEKAIKHWKRYIILNPDDKNVVRVKEHLLELTREP